MLFSKRKKQNNYEKKFGVYFIFSFKQFTQTENNDTFNYRLN